MTLVESMMEDCTMIDKKTVEDDLGGFTTKWVDGAVFRAAVTKSRTIQTKIAEKQGVTEVYQITVKKGTPLAFHDVVRRNSDGAVFRIKSNIKDSETPEVAGLKLGVVDAERWELK